jgi:hypothetical protein
MSRPEPTLYRLPTETELFWAPERAALAALDASLVLSIRALKAAHPLLGDSDEAPNGNEPLLLLGESLLATARSLHELIEGYDDLVERLTRYDSSIAARAPRSPDDDIPF